jgi:hydroxymethylbilane synthase
MIILGSRGSDLALWQARHIQQLLSERAGAESRIEIIQTAGDRVTDVSLASLGGKGLFTKEIEEALLRGDIDLAVHSHKDLPTESPSGLVVAAVPERGPAGECLAVREEAWTAADPLPLREGAVVGTGSARRRAQLAALRSDLDLCDLRGNVPTRLRKVAEGRYDAIVLAKAGLVRLGLAPDGLRIHDLTIEEMVPAPAQGALAIQIRAGGAARAGDAELAAILARLHHEPTARCVEAERRLLASFAGGCNLPLGAHATLENGGLRLLAVLEAGDGRLRRCDVRGMNPVAAAEAARWVLSR